MSDAATLFGLAAFVLSFAALLHTGASIWLRWRAADRESDAEALAATVREQLARIEMTLEIQSTEIERLGEAQRYSARLLAERAPVNADVSPTHRAGRVVTPH
jgi:hypothetical protein